MCLTPLDRKKRSHMYNTSARISILWTIQIPFFLFACNATKKEEEENNTNTHASLQDTSQVPIYQAIPSSQKKIIHTQKAIKKPTSLRIKSEPPPPLSLEAASLYSQQLATTKTVSVSKMQQFQEKYLHNDTTYKNKKEHQIYVKPSETEQPLPNLFTLHTAPPPASSNSKDFPLLRKTLQTYQEKWQDSTTEENATIKDAWIKELEKTYNGWNSWYLLIYYRNGPAMYQLLKLLKQESFAFLKPVLCKLRKQPPPNGAPPAPFSYPKIGLSALGMGIGTSGLTAGMLLLPSLAGLLSLILAPFVLIGSTTYFIRSLDFKNQWEYVSEILDQYESTHPTTN